MSSMVNITPKSKKRYFTYLLFSSARRGKPVPSVCFTGVISPANVSRCKASLTTEECTSLAAKE